MSHGRPHRGIFGLAVAAAVAALGSGCIAGKTAAPRDAAALSKAAEADLAAGRAEKAQLGYEAALRLEPRLLPALRGRIEAARRRGALAPVIAVAAARTEAAPQDALGWETLGLARFAAGEEKAAVAALSKAAALAPDEADFHFRLGIALFDGEKFADARAPLQRAVELQPEDAVINGHLGDAMAAMGRWREAEYQWRRALLLKPDPEDAERINQKLSTLPQGRLPTQASVPAATVR